MAASRETSSTGSLAPAPEFVVDFEPQPDSTKEFAFHSCFHTIDSARIERRRALDRERQRRRRENPMVRAKESAAKRQRREANPELRKKSTEAKRRQRQANPELTRKKATEAQRRRRQANPELIRKKAREAQRRRRQANPELIRKETEARRLRRQANPELREKAAQAKRQQRKHNLQLQNKETQVTSMWRQVNLDSSNQEAEENRKHKEIPLTEGADGRFKRDFLNQEFGHSCVVCDRLWFDHNLTQLKNVRNPETHVRAIEVLEQEFPTTSTSVEDFHVCATCKDSLLAGKLPAMSVTDKYRVHSHVVAMPANIAGDCRMFCRKGTQAVVTTADIGTQCAVAFLSSAGCQTEDELPETEVDTSQSSASSGSCGRSAVVPELAKGAVKEEVLADQRGGSSHLFLLSTF